MKKYTIEIELSDLETLFLEQLFLKTKIKEKEHVLDIDSGDISNVAFSLFEKGLINITIFDDGTKSTIEISPIGEKIAIRLPDVNSFVYTHENGSYIEGISMSQARNLQRRNCGGSISTMPIKI